MWAHLACSWPFFPLKFDTLGLIHQLYQYNCRDLCLNANFILVNSLLLSQEIRFLTVQNYLFLHIRISLYVQINNYVVVVQSLSRILLFVTPWTAAGQAYLSFTISQSLLKSMAIELMMPSNHLILCHPLLLLPSIFPSIDYIP